MSVYDVQLGTRFLAALDADWACLITTAEAWQQPARVADSPYGYLLHAIAHQHVHARAASSLLERLSKHFGGMPTPRQLCATDPAEIKALGFSSAKTNALLDLAQHALQGGVPEEAEAVRLADTSLHQQLTAIRGIGPWTVDMLLMFHLGRTDILPSGDFGVREGFRRLKKKPKQPSASELTTLGKDWSPHRTLASWYLWQAARLLPVPDSSE